MQKKHCKIFASVAAAVTLFFILPVFSAFKLQISESAIRFRDAVLGKYISRLEFSAGDVLYTFTALCILILLGGMFFRSARVKSFCWLLILWSVFFPIYQLVWGLQYNRELFSISEKNYPDFEVKKLTAKILFECKQLREKVPENRNGVFADERKANADFPFSESDKSAAHYGGGTKPSLYSAAMSYTGILGYYNPFTGEAQYNHYLPATQLTFTIAHERCHQKGATKEYDANALAYFKLKKSKNPQDQYAAKYFFLKSLLYYFTQKDPEFADSIRQNYSEGMKRDAAFEKKFFLEHESVLNTVFGTLNDLFLKLNGEAGQISYQYSTKIIMDYELRDYYRTQQ